MRHQQIGGANDDIHGTAPIDAVARRVGGDEIQHLIAEFARIFAGTAKAPPLGSRQGMGMSELGEMVHARQLPRHLGVGARHAAVADIAVPNGFAPAIARFEIEMPIDRREILIDKRPDIERRPAARGIEPGRQIRRPPAARQSRRGFVTIAFDARARHAVANIGPARAENVETVTKVFFAEFRESRFPAVIALDFTRLKIKLARWRGGIGQIGPGQSVPGAQAGGQSPAPCAFENAAREARLKAPFNHLCFLSDRMNILVQKSSAVIAWNYPAHKADELREEYSVAKK